MVKLKQKRLQDQGFAQGTTLVRIIEMAADIKTGLPPEKVDGWPAVPVDEATPVCDWRPAKEGE